MAARRRQPEPAWIRRRKAACGRCTWLDCPMHAHTAADRQLRFASPHYTCPAGRWPPPPKPDNLAVQT